LELEAQVPLLIQHKQVAEFQLSHLLHQLAVEKEDHLLLELELLEDLAEDMLINQAHKELQEIHPLQVHHKAFQEEVQETIQTIKELVAELHKKDKILLTLDLQQVQHQELEVETEVL
tara:strand:+ start:210 stop:563 length:354 start_codon:yes stop_codon:yes gene_type:complete